MPPYNPAVRILVVNYEYPPLGGGGGVLTKTLVAELAGKHDVTVLTTRGAGTAADAFEDGAHIVRVSVTGRRDAARASLVSMLSFVPAGRLRARSLARDGSFDLVHTFFAVPTGPVGSAVARALAVPHVLTVIGADVHDPSRLSPDRFRPLGAVVRRIVRGAAAVTAISSDIAARATRLTGRDDIEVVSCASPELSFPPRDRAALGWADNEFVVLAVARLVARKGLDSLIRAVAGIPDGVRLEIVGDGPERAALEALAAEAAPGRVRFAGAVDAAGKALRLASADAFALPSLHEGFGLVYLEAMQAGLPVVAGDAGGQTDFLTDGRNALLVPPGDAGRLAQALTTLAGDAALREAIAAAGKKTAAAFTPGRMAADYERTYQRALTTTPSRS